VANTEPCWEGRATSSEHWGRGTVTSPLPVTLPLPATVLLPVISLLPHREMRLSTNRSEL